MAALTVVFFSACPETDSDKTLLLPYIFFRTGDSNIPDPQLNIGKAQMHAIYENGNSTSFSLALATPPNGIVKIDAVVMAPNQIVLNPDSVTFLPEDWDIPRIITISGEDNYLTDGNRIVTVQLVVDSASTTDTLGYSNLPISEDSTLHVTVLDDDQPAYVLDTTSLSPISESGGSSTFGVKLNSKPTGSVTLDLSSQNTFRANVAPSTLTFTISNWNVLQTATITGVDDSIINGDEDVSILLSRNPATTDTSGYENIDPPDILARVLDDDRPVTCTGTGTDGYEADNTYDCATRISTDGKPQRHTIAPAGDIDYFSFEVIDTSTLYMIDVSDRTGDCTGKDTFLTLYSTDGLTMLRNDDSAGFRSCSRLSVQFSTPGIYYFSVKDDPTDTEFPEQFDYTVQITQPEYYVIETRKTANVDTANTVVMLMDDESVGGLNRGCYVDLWSWYSATSDIGGGDPADPDESGYSRILCPKEVIPPGPRLIWVVDFWGFQTGFDLFSGAYSLSIRDNSIEPNPCPASINNPGNGTTPDIYESADNEQIGATPIQIGCEYAQDHTLTFVDNDFFLVNFP